MMTEGPTPIERKRRKDAEVIAEHVATIAAMRDSHQKTVKWLENERDYEALRAATAIAALVTTRAALEWYGENARLCRLIHSGGDPGRHALSADGGKRAKAVLQGSDDTGGAPA